MRQTRHITTCGSSSSVQPVQARYVHRLCTVQFICNVVLVLPGTAVKYTVGACAMLYLRTSTASAYIHNIAALCTRRALCTYVKRIDRIMSHGRQVWGRKSVFVQNHRRKQGNKLGMGNYHRGLDMLTLWGARKCGSAAAACTAARAA